MLSVRPKLQGILGNGAIFFLQSMRSLVCIGKDHLQILPHKQRSQETKQACGRNRKEKD